MISPQRIISAALEKSREALTFYISFFNLLLMARQVLAC